MCYIIFVLEVVRRVRVRPPHPSPLHGPQKYA